MTRSRVLMNKVRDATWLLSLAALLLVAVVGCGKKEPPRPPASKIPAAIDDLTLHQRGQRAVDVDDLSDDNHRRTGAGPIFSRSSCGSSPARCPLPRSRSRTRPRMRPLRASSLQPPQRRRGRGSESTVPRSIAADGPAGSSPRKHTSVWCSRARIWKPRWWETASRFACL